MKALHNPQLMALNVIFLVLFVFTTMATTISGHSVRYMRPDLEQVPIDQLIENMKARVKDEPDNSNLAMNLGRVHAMAFARGTQEMSLHKSNDPQTPNTTEPWFGYDPDHLPFVNLSGTKKPADDEATKQHLASAIEMFQRAVEMDKENLPAQLSLAWCQDQAGEKMESIVGYRDVISKGWDKEKDVKVAGLAFRSIVGEAAIYLRPHLDPEFDKEEIADLDSKLKKLANIIRPITPIAIPMGKQQDLQFVVDKKASVRFDADGSGLPKQWTWIQPESGWLVYDQHGDGKIQSALQLFGNVTFWCFWDNGFDALKSLDANRDGELSGDEIRNLAIWVDRNSNGVSEVGEVRTLRSTGIAAVLCTGREYKMEPGHISDSKTDCLLWNPQGVRFIDDRTCPTYDVILHPADR